MKTLDIAWKDLLRSFRSIFFLVFGFIVPLLVSGLFYIAFGSAGGEGGHFNLPRTRVVLVNLDRPAASRGDFSAGQSIAALFESEQIAKILEVTTATDAATARAAVDRGESGVAVILPENMTAALLSPATSATVELYSDPTLTLGPAIVKAILRSVVDSFAGTRIAVDVTTRQLSAHGITPDEQSRQAVVMGYVTWTMGLIPEKEGLSGALLRVRAPEGAKDANTRVGAIIGKIMAGMLVFYAFYTGAASCQSLLEEEESGTLARLFTTPTPVSAILGGRFLSTLANLALQVTVLLVVSHLAFGIAWGEPLGLALVALGIVLVAAGFGLFVTSLLKNVRQSGIVYGGVLTILGMLGMLGVFTGIDPRQASTLNTVALFVPQGWGVRGLLLLLHGQGVLDILPSVAVLVGLGVAFFLIGLWRFRRRFA